MKTTFVLQFCKTDRLKDSFNIYCLELSIVLNIFNDFIVTFLIFAFVLKLH